MLVKAVCTEGSVFNPIEDDHYITFYQDSRCSELSFVMTESCAIGISWDDQIHYDWINYLSHFADQKRTYTEWEMVDSYGKYPWYKEKVADF